MSPSRRQLATATAVFVGSLGLFTPPIFVAVQYALELLVGAFGARPLTGIVHLLVVVVSALVALETASEIAAMRLGGMRALQRGGSRRRLARHAILSISAISVLVVAVEVVVRMLWWNVVNWNPAVVALALVVAAGLCWSGVRIVSSFRAGYREPVVEEAISSNEAKSESESD